LDKAIIVHCRKYNLGTTATKLIATKVHVPDTREVQNFAREISVVLRSLRKSQSRATILNM